MMTNEINKFYDHDSNSSKEFARFFNTHLPYWGRPYSIKCIHIDFWMVVLIFSLLFLLLVLFLNWIVLFFVLCAACVGFYLRAWTTWINLILRLHSSIEYQIFINNSTATLCFLRNFYYVFFFRRFSNKYLD